MSNKLNTNYNHIRNEVLSAYTHSAVDKTTTSTFIKDGLGLTGSITSAVQKLDTNVTTILYPTPAQNAERRALRKTVRVELGRLATQLNLDYPNDEAALRSSGLDMAANSGQGRRPLELGPPTEVELVDGSQPNYLYVRGKRPHGALQNLIRTSIDSAVPAEEGKVHVGGGREREIGPFPSGALVELVWACLSSSTTEPVYCAPVRRRVQ